MEMIAQQCKKQRKTLRFLAECFLVLILVVGKSGTIGAQEATEGAKVSEFVETQLNLPEGGGDDKGKIRLKLPTNKLDFPELVVDTSPQKVAIPIAKNGSGIEVRDTRRNMPGWNLTVTGSHMIDGLETISVRNMGIEPKGVRVIAGPGEGIVLGPIAAFLDTNQPLVVATAQAGSGVGVFEIDCDLFLTVPANIVAGDYSGELTFTVQ